MKRFAKLILIYNTFAVDNTFVCIFQGYKTYFYDIFMTLIAKNFYLI